MLNFYSWRWSQLLRRSAVKRVFTHIDQIFILMIFEALILAMFFRENPLLLQKMLFVWLIIGIILFDILAVICLSDQYYTIKSGSKIKYRIYLYTSGLYSGDEDIEMIILNDKKEYQIRSKIKADYRYYRWSNWSSFLFCSASASEWFYVSTLDDIIPLGNKVGETIYRTPQKPNQMTILCDHGTMVVDAETFFFKGAYVPPAASKNIYDADTEEKLESPQDYLIAKRGKHYTVYGLYHYSPGASAPQCCCLRIPNIIFKAGDQEVILQWNDEYGYREIYKTQHSVKRQVNNVFVELTYQKGIGGTVKKFNEKTQKPQLLYRGYFHGIDFETGAIIGDNFEYNP